MNDRTGGTRLLRRGGALAVAVAVAVLTTACGLVHVHFGSSGGSASTGSATYRAELAYAQCMRAHGLPGFPEPKPSGGLSFHHQRRPHRSAHLDGNPNSPAARANDACKHLLSGGSTGTGAHGAGAPARPVRCRLTAWPPGRRVTHPGSSGLPTASSRCSIAGSPAAGRPSSCRNSPLLRQDRRPAVTDIRQDLARFDALFGLPAARLQVVNTLAHAASPWLASTEEVGDTEIVHALAPGAAIREVLIPSPYTASLGKVSAAVVAALRLGLAHGGVISLSAGAGEQCFTPAEVAQVNSVLQAAQRDRVTVVVSTGDSGAATTACPPETGSAAVKGVDLPASDPLTLAVGGTSLQASRDNRCLHRRDRVEHPSLGGGTCGRRRRVQPAVPPARLPGWHRRHRGHPGRARRSCRR